MGYGEDREGDEGDITAEQEELGREGEGGRGMDTTTVHARIWKDALLQAGNVAWRLAFRLPFVR